MKAPSAIVFRHERLKGGISRKQKYALSVIRDIKFTGNINIIGLIAAVACLAFIIYMLFFKKYSEAKTLNLRAVR